MDYIVENQKTLNALSKGMYFIPSIDVFNENLESLINKGMSEADATRDNLNHLTNILKGSESRVEEIIQNRVLSGAISDASQARKSVAGNNYQRLVAYGIIRNILIGNITKEIIVKVGYNKHELLDKYATIIVGDSQDIQKPDSDVLIYKNDNSSPIINFSCKTSLRERAGQTYKWKLLVDIASSTCPHIPITAECPKNIYRLQYDSSRRVFMNFVTADLYNEVNQPQISGMFNFFDNAYITKSSDEFTSSSINCFEYFIDYINDLYD